MFPTGGAPFTVAACGIELTRSAMFVESRWQQPTTGIDGAAFAQIVAGRASPDNVYVIGSGALYRSMDKGVSWSRTTPPPVAIQSVTVTPAEVSIAVGSGQVLRSEDLGETWLPASSGTDGAVAEVVAGPDATLLGVLDRRFALREP